MQDINFDDFKEYAKAMLIDDMDKEEYINNYKYEDINPAFQEKNIAICIVASDEYAPFASVVVQSIIENSKRGNNYDIILLSDDMLLNNRWRIEKQAVNYSNISIRIIDISEKIKGFKFYTWAHFTSNTYYRLLTPDLFHNYDKILYLDSDVVVVEDVAELYNIDIEGYLIGATYDTHVVSYCSQKPPLEQREYNIKTLKLDNPEEYFQAGVSLFNIKEFRNKHEDGYLISKALKSELRWLDQDLINMVCKGKIKRIPNKWNVMVANTAPYIDEYYLPEDLRKEYFQSRLNPGIIHYVGRAIPCYTTKPDLYEYYWKYARQTPFYEIIIQRMVCDYTTKAIELNNHNVEKKIRELTEIINLLRVELGNNCSIEENRKSNFKQKLKSLLKPIYNIIFPIGTKRRYLFKKTYFKLRGWDI